MLRKSYISLLPLLILTLLFSPAIRSPLKAQTKQDRIHRFLEEFSSRDLLNGVVLVGQKDRIIYQKAFGYAVMEWDVRNTIDGRFRIGSMTKQFTAALVMILRQENKLDLDDPVTRFLPYYRSDTGKKVTIHHLLNHTSGIPEYNNAENFWQDST